MIPHHTWKDFLRRVKACSHLCASVFVYKGEQYAKNACGGQQHRGQENQTGMSFKFNPKKKRLEPTPLNVTTPSDLPAPMLRRKSNNFKIERNICNSSHVCHKQEKRRGGKHWNENIVMKTRAFTLGSKTSLIAVKKVRKKIFFLSRET